MALNFSDLELFYEELAKALDTIAEAEREVFLCKLGLLMARELGDLPLIRDMIQSAQNHLEAVSKRDV